MESPNGVLDHYPTDVVSRPHIGGDTISTSAAPNDELDGQSNLQNDLVIFAKNARINNSAQLTQLLGELRGISWDIVLFSETRMQSGQQILDGGHKLYTSLDNNQFAGVGILIHAKHIKKSIRVHNISGRVLGLDVCINGTKIRVVAIYLPHCGYDVEDFDQAFDQIRCIVDQGQKNKRTNIIRGVFNTQTNVGYRGMQLHSLIISFGLSIANKSDTPWDMQWIFESSMGIKRKIDFIIVSASLGLLVGMVPTRFIWVPSIER